MPTNAEVLRMSQIAPQSLPKQPVGVHYATVFTGLVNGESVDKWSNHEQLILSCLQSGDDETALVGLERSINRFGPENENVAALRGIYKEAVAEDSKVLIQVLREYENILDKSPTNLVPIYAVICTVSIT